MTTMYIEWRNPNNERNPKPAPRNARAKSSSLGNDLNRRGTNRCHSCPVMRILSFCLAQIAVQAQFGSRLMPEVLVQSGRATVLLPQMVGQLLDGVRRR